MQSFQGIIVKRLKAFSTICGKCTFKRRFPEENFPKKGFAGRRIIRNYAGSVARFLHVVGYNSYGIYNYLDALCGKSVTVAEQGAESISFRLFMDELRIIK